MTSTAATARFVAPGAALSPRGLDRAVGGGNARGNVSSLRRVTKKDTTTAVVNTSIYASGATASSSSTSGGSAAFASSSPSTSPYSGPPRIVVLGGGFGGLYTALRLDSLTWPDYAKKPIVTLLDRSERFVFKPMLYELVNETMNDWEVAPTFQDLLAPTSVTFQRGSVATVEPNEALLMRDGSTGSSGGGAVILDSGDRVEYDYLVVAVGTGSSDIGVPGAKEHAIPLSTLPDAQRLAAAMRDVAGKASRGRVAVVGGGLAGVELAGVVAERLKGSADVELMASQSGIMASSPAGQREAAARSLAAAGVTVRKGVRATRVGPPTSWTAGATNPSSSSSSSSSSSPSSSLPSAASLTFTSPAAEGETTENYDVVCWAVGQRVESPEAWPFPRDQRSKKIVTDATLRVSGHARVFALGDVASATGEAAAAAAADLSSGSSKYNAAAPPPAAFPSTAQVAFQQADYAAWNLWASIAERPLLPFKYQHLGDMMVLGKVDAAVALPVGDATIDGPLAALLRRAAYLYRMPTNEHRAKLATNWLQQSAQFAVDEGPGILKKMGVPVPDFVFTKNTSA